MKKALFLLSAALLLPISQVWAGNDKYYHASFTASASNSGMGKVYAGTSTTSTPSYEETSSVGATKSAANTKSVVFHVYAKAEEGYEFTGWTKGNATTLSDENTSADKITSYVKATVATESESSVSAVAGGVTASFRELSYDSFQVTFLKPAVGSYTVDGTSVGDGLVLPDSATTKAYKPILVASVPEGYAFKRWYTADGETLSTAANTTLTFTSAKTVGAEFMEAVEAKDLNGLIASLAANDCTTIKSGTTIIIPNGTTVTVPTGKSLVNQGVLVVAGTLNGAAQITGGGTVYKVAKRINQSEPITPTNAMTSYTSITLDGAYSDVQTTVKYCTTEVLDGGSVSGTPTCTLLNGVLLNGKDVFEVDVTDPNALEVTFDATKAINSISSVSKTTVSEITKNGSFLLLKNTTLSGPTAVEKGSNKDYTRYGFNGTIDLAGKKCTMGTSYQVGGYFIGRVVNGSFTYPATTSLWDEKYWQYGVLLAINCPSVNINLCKLGLNRFYFFDCGTKANPAAVTVSYFTSTRTTDYRYAYYYSGVYNVSFNDTDDANKTFVYGGLFQNDPNKYLADTKTMIAKQSADDNNYYLVRQKLPTDDVVKIGDVGYTSLQAAVDAATAGAILKLNNVFTLSGTVTIAAGKNLTIDLNGIDLTGGSIENSGALRFADYSFAATKGVLSTPVTNKGSGTIIANGGTYAGTFTLNGGSLTTYGGSFSSTFSVVQSGGTAHLHGGSFDNDVTPLLETNYRRVGKKVGHYIEAGMTSMTISGAQVAYKVKALTPDTDFDYYKGYLNGKKERGDYASDAEWDTVSELVSSVSPYDGCIMECTLSFDRNVKANTIDGYGSVNGMSQSSVLDTDVAVGSYYRVLRPVLQQYGGGDKRYPYFFTDSQLQNAGFGVANKSTTAALENIGTTCTLAVRLYIEETPTTCLASRTYKFAGKGAIAGTTDHTSLQAAVNAVADGATVRLSQDCSAAVTVSAMKTFVLDNNNFSFTGSITAGTGYKLAETTDLGGGKTQYRFVATHTVTVPAVAHATVSVAVGGTVVGTQAGNYTVDHGQKVVVTYAAETGYDLATKTVTYESVTENKTVPEQEATAIPYAITYELGEGGQNHPANPATYTIESETITLKAPTRAGYLFTGWKDSDGTIAKGSTGEKTFTATWKKSTIFFVK